ncbi:hypothetical protein [Sulfurimonas sp.]|uniref:hypothetical protein n=1 Tax=Sulfurimonas sp. TaxID=2022749 RepID=UPI002AB0B4D7|nr:hypothetical protein [Sulfurimonas sp.]
MFKVIFSALIITIAIFIKEITIFSIEQYTSSLLKKDVKVTSFELTSLIIQAYIEKENNNVKVQIINLFPLKALVDYTGDINAFKVYQPLQAKIKTQANITYDDELYLDANVSLIKQQLSFTTKLYLDANNSIDLKIYTSHFGGHLNLHLINERLEYMAKDLHLSKLLRFAKQKPLAKGYINLNGTLDTKTLDASFILDSPKIFTPTQNIKNIKLFVSKLTYKDENLDINYTFNSEILNKNISFYGDANYHKYLIFNATNKNFSGTNTFNLKNEKFTFSLKHLDIKELLKFSSKKTLASGKLSIEGNGDFNKIDLDIKSDVHIDEQIINIKSSATYKIKTNSLNSKINITIPLNNEILEVDANLKFDKHLSIDANSSSFDSLSILKIDKENFDFSIQDIDLMKLSNALEYKNTIFGHLDFKAKGTLKNIDFKIKSHYIKNNMLLGKINDSISLNISGNYTPKLLTLKDNFTLHYKKEKIPIQMMASIHLDAPYNSKGSFLYANDKFVINSFSYENKHIKGDFFIDIQDLYKYRSLTSIKLYNAMKIKGSYTDMLRISTNSLGGVAKFTLNDKLVNIELKNISVDKVALLLDKNKLIEHGHIDATTSYNLLTKTAKSDISVNNILIKGIDIDKTLSTLNDALGLNVISISKSLISNIRNTHKSKTDIKQLQFNISLKDEIVNLDDVALKTNKFRIVALGELKDNGDINKLNISIVDKNGCAIITQGLNGNIKNPKTAKTTTTIVNIAQSIPSSILGTGRKILDFGTNTIDGVASFGVQKVLRTEKEISLTSDVISKSSSLMSFTSNVILPKDCKVIYDGVIKHPKIKEGESYEKKF